MNLSDCPTRGLTHFLSSGKRKIPKQEKFIFFFVFFVFIFLSFAYISYCNDVIRIFIYSLLRV
jgi:ABC-type Na+ efflux pump permease subunit